MWQFLLQRLIQRNPEKIKNWLLIKDFQILSHHHETWSKRPPHWFIILTKFYDDCSKIVDILLIVNFWSCPDIFWISLYALKHMLKSHLTRPQNWKKKSKILNYQFISAILSCSCVAPEPTTQRFLLMSSANPTLGHKAPSGVKLKPGLRTLY